MLYNIKHFRDISHIDIQLTSTAVDNTLHTMLYKADCLT